MHRSARRWRLLPITLLAITAASCNWVSLAEQALTYAEVRRGEAGNVVALDSIIYATNAEDGLRILEARSGRTLALLPPAAGSGSVDDLAIDGRLLFVLDARAPGALSAWSLDDPVHPRLMSAPREVPVGPFAGVSAAGGLCIVSGGTSQLTAWRYDSAGALTGPMASTDLGRGQPEVLVAGHDGLAYVSTHFWGPYFGLDITRYDSSARHIELLAKLDLDGAGFTDGGAKPANFPIAVAALNRDTVLVANARGLTVVNVSRPEAPRVETVVDVGGAAVHVHVLGSTAAVTVAQPHPAVVLVAFASGRATVIRRIPLEPGTNPAGVALLPSLVAVAARDRGVLVLSR